MRAIVFSFITVILENDQLSYVEYKNTMGKAGMAVFFFWQT